MLELATTCCVQDHQEIKVDVAEAVVDLRSSMLEAQSASHGAVTERGLPTAADFMRRP